MRGIAFFGLTEQYPSCDQPVNPFDQQYLEHWPFRYEKPSLITSVGVSAGECDESETHK